MDNKEMGYRRKVGLWRSLCVCLAVACGLLLIAVIVLAASHSNNDTHAVPVCGQGGVDGVRSKVIDMSEPEHPGPFHDLTKKEIQNLLDFLEKDPGTKVKKTEEAQMMDSVVFTMDLLPAKKVDVNAYLDDGRDQPERQARVILFRGDLDPPMVHELACGPLPEVTSCSLIQSGTRRNPVEFSVRPASPIEYYAMDSFLLKKVDEQMGYILRESYGMSYYNCEVTGCLRWFQSPVGTGLVGDISARRMWLWATYPTDYYMENVVDFGMLANLDGSDPSKYHIYKIWYNQQFFESVDDFTRQYNNGRINKTSQSPPSMDPRESFSSLYRQGDPLPETPQRPPTLVEPDGKRYSLKGREVDYLGWKFNFRMSPLSGPFLNNIRYKGERIAYELGLAEIAVFYSADNPMKRATNYADSGYFIGTHAKSLVPGGDCPSTATFINQTFPGQTKWGSVEIGRAWCLFENNHGYPLRRHLSYTKYEGNFYGGMLDSALTLRTIVAIGNYDYVIDYIFHQSGAIQTRVMNTGYIISSVYNEAERPYGFQTQRNFVANLHHHMFHFKADLDVSGTSNRYETLDIQPDTVTMRAPPHPEYHQSRFERHLYRKETDALYHYHFDQPKYHLVHNNDAKTTYGEIKAYRIVMEGMSKQLRPEGLNNEPSVAWARHQMAVTRHKDQEQLSSSPYAMFDSLNPVTNFTKFYDDDENIVDKDLVLWISSGLHHIPHSEDLPITPTVGAHLSFFLVPFNYFPQCPSFASRDHIRVELKDRNRPSEGVRVDRHGYVDQQCRTPQWTTAYAQLVDQDPDVVLQSRKEHGLL